MFLYLIIFIFAVIGYLKIQVTGTRSKRYFACWMLFLCLFVGLSDMLGGYDRYIYGEIFDSIADQTSVGTAWNNYNYLGHDNEVGYQYLNILFSFLTSNRYIFILFITILIYIFFFFALKEYIVDSAILIILFLSLIFFFTFTYIREMLAVSILALSYRYIIKRDFKRFFVLFIIAFSIHNSAIIFFFMYFIPIKKYTIQTIIIAAFLLFLIGLSPFPRMLFVQYGNVSEDVRIEQNLDTMSFRIEYLIEALFFLFIILKNYDLVKDRKEDIVFLNTSILFCFLLLLFVRSVNGGRLSWYFTIGLMVTLVNIFNRMNMSYKSMIMVVSVFLYLRVLFSWGIFLYPYKTFLTNGHREKDPMFQRYEYDLNYDDDKLYK